jgi:hypothetical protein
MMKLNRCAIAVEPKRPHYNRNEYEQFARSKSELPIAKLSGSPSEKNDSWRREEGLIMDDSPADILVPQEGPAEAFSETHPAEATKVEATIVESKQTPTVPSNGSSPRKIEANRRNAQKSTGPKTSRGKAMSSFNSISHGLLSKRLPFMYGRGKRQFNHMLTSLQRDLEPVGTLEEVLVEKIAQEYWRLGVAARHEAEAFEQRNPFSGHWLPTIMRYQTTINRQLFQAMNQLERVQRLRKGENVPSPLNLQISGDTPTLSETENSDL